MTNIIFCGKGGQGILFASNLFTQYLFNYTNNYISSSDIHGLVKRGGAVSSEIKFGKEFIYSPVVEDADYIVDFDGNEFLNYQDRFKKTSTIIIPDNKEISSSCNIIQFDLYNLLLKNHLHPQQKNMIILGYFVKILNMESPNWKKIIKSHSNYLAFLVGTNG